MSSNNSQDFILTKLRKEHNIKFKNEENEKISEESYTDRINISNRGDKDSYNNLDKILVTNSNEEFSTIRNNSMKVNIQLENNYSNDQIVNYKGIINSNSNTPKSNPNFNNNDSSNNFRSRALLNIIKTRKENTNN